MEDFSIEGAALYSFGIDPDTIRLELEHCGHEDNSLDELPKDFQERLRIIKSAVCAGSIHRAVVDGDNSSGCHDQTRILKKSFLEWRNHYHADWKHAEAIAAYPKNKPDFRHYGLPFPRSQAYLGLVASPDGNILR